MLRLKGTVSCFLLINLVEAVPDAVSVDRESHHCESDWYATRKRIVHRLNALLPRLMPSRPNKLRGSVQLARHNITQQVGADNKKGPEHELDFAQAERHRFVLLAD